MALFEVMEKDARTLERERAWFRGRNAERTFGRRVGVDFDRHLAKILRVIARRNRRLG